MRSLPAMTALAILLAAPVPALAQGTAGGPQGQVPAGPLPMTQPPPGTPSTSQRPSTASGALGATAGQAAGQAMDEDRARELLRSQGYGDVQDLTRDAAGFRARAMQNGRAVDVTIDAATGTVRSQSAAR